MGLDSIVSRIMHEACLEGPKLTGNQPWWLELDPDFSRQKVPFNLGITDKIQVESTAITDVALRTLGACLLGTLAMPSGFNPFALERSACARDFYGEIAESGNPDKLFVAPPKSIRFQRSQARMPLFLPRDGFCEDVYFKSPFKPVYPAERRRYLSTKENRFAHARFWKHLNGPRSTIIAIHGFSADFYHLNEWFFGIQNLYAIGYDILLFTLPFHGQRQSRFSPFSGQGFFAGGLSGINEAFAQAIFDLRIFMNHLLEEGVPQIGVMGVSLGGQTSALLASVDSRLAFAIPNVPAVSLADLALEWEPIATLTRLALKTTSTTVHDLRHMIAASCPLTYKPRIPKDRLMIIGGVGDRLVPPKHSTLLWDHWGRCRLHWFPGSHLIHMDRGGYLQQIEQFFNEIEFHPNAAPSR